MTAGGATTARVGGAAGAGATAPIAPLHDEHATVGFLATLTGREPVEVLELLRREYADPGRIVRDDFTGRGLTPFVWSDGLARFYAESDAFLFELALWNVNAAKVAMRRWIGRYLARDRRPLRVLMLGDGIGCDSVHLARRGHDVSFHEVPGFTFDAASRVFAINGVQVGLRPERPSAGERFDVVVCLDVLEHVPDPDADLEAIRSWLAPGGRLVVHAPFYMIHPATITHLAANRRLAGSVRLFERHGFRLIEGVRSWTPIVLQLGDEGLPARRSSRAVGRIRAMGLAFALGRWTPLPALAALSVRRRGAAWFGVGAPASSSRPR